MIGGSGEGADADDTEIAVDRMTEEELLKGLEGLTPPEEQPEQPEIDEEDYVQARQDWGALARADCRIGAVPCYPERPGGAKGVPGPPGAAVGLRQ